MTSTVYSKFGSQANNENGTYAGQAGENGVGFLLTPTGDYDIQDVNFVNVDDIQLNSISSSSTIPVTPSITTPNLQLTNLSVDNTSTPLALNASNNIVLKNDIQTFNQSLNTTDSPTFNEITINSIIGPDIDIVGTLTFDSINIDNTNTSLLTLDASNNVEVRTVASLPVLNPFDQDLNTTDDVQFNQLSVTNITGPTLSITVDNNLSMIGSTLAITPGSELSFTSIGTSTENDYLVLDPSNRVRQRQIGDTNLDMKNNDIINVGDISCYNLSVSRVDASSGSDIYFDNQIDMVNNNISNIGTSVSNRTQTNEITSASASVDVLKDFDMQTNDITNIGTITSTISNSNKFKSTDYTANRLKVTKTDNCTANVPVTPLNWTVNAPASGLLGFNIANGFFTAPEEGLYSFDLLFKINTNITDIQICTYLITSGGQVIFYDSRWPSDVSAPIGIETGAHFNGCRVLPAGLSVRFGVVCNQSVSFDLDLEVNRIC